MPTQILMPALSPTMEEGTLAKWHVKEGDTVASGDVIAEIETDKATMEVESIDEGTVARILVSEGTENVKVNALIAVLLEDGEDAASVDLSAMAAPAAAPAAAQPAPAPAEPAAQPAPAAPAAAAPAPAAQPAPPKANGQGGRVFASPLARRLAQQNNIELALLAGSGPHGRIVKRDIDKALKDGVPQAAVSTARALVPMAPSDQEILALFEEGSYEVVPHDGMRKIIAERLQVSKQTIPHFYLTLTCELDKLLALRATLNDRAPKDDDGKPLYKLSVNDFIIKALAQALQKVPDANVTWTDSGMLKHTHSDVGVAVAVEGGLFTPVIRAAETKGLAEISNEMKDLAGRARKRRLAPHEYQGGTTAVSNLGMFGISHFSAVINPPHATIIAVGAGEKTPVVSGNDVVIRTVMSATLSCDHRAVDGALGAQLLDAFKGFLEEPGMMLV
ncbi:MAG: pyruvate dehydrogenase complex dihydrolipoamide acetyltransferase [Hyphomicrobiales bacterium]